MEIHSETLKGILRSAATAADGGRRCVHFDGSVPVLLVLRSVAGADVLSDWHLGWREPSLCSHQVFPVHAGRIGGHAAGRFEDLLPDPGHGAHEPDYAGNSGLTGWKLRSLGEDRKSTRLN